MKVLVFGAFDPLHAGHEHFFEQAARLGDELLVVVAGDQSILTDKGRQPFQPEAVRMAAVKACNPVTAAVLGGRSPHHYQLLQELDFDILALGYDQKPSIDEVHAILKKYGKSRVTVVRLLPHQPERYKSSLVRDKK